MTRDDLIARKGELQAEIAQVVRRLEQARSELESASGIRRRFLAGRVGALEGRLEALAAEESRLRLAIDRSARRDHGAA